MNASNAKVPAGGLAASLAKHKHRISEFLTIGVAQGESVLKIFCYPFGRLTRQVACQGQSRVFTHPHDVVAFLNQIGGAA